jgi:hypothetical protein
MTFRITRLSPAEALGVVIELYLRSESLPMTVAKARIGGVVVSRIRSVPVMSCVALSVDMVRLVGSRWRKVLGESPPGPGEWSSSACVI